MVDVDQISCLHIVFVFIGSRRCISLNLFTNISRLILLLLSEASCPKANSANAESAQLQGGLGVLPKKNFEFWIIKHLGSITYFPSFLLNVTMSLQRVHFLLEIGLPRLFIFLVKKVRGSMLGQRC